MRWLILLSLLVIAGASSKQGCYVREFYGIAYTVHDPTLRHKEMMAWLNLNAGHCKSTEYLVIWNNLSEWAGTADSTWLRNKVVHGYKDALEREKK
jgi:hypothetical protein